MKLLIFKTIIYSNRRIFDYIIVGFAIRQCHISYARRAIVKGIKELLCY
jgi:hypothetical protein